jgi:hypothetical protein
MCSFAFLPFQLSRAHAHACFESELKVAAAFSGRLTMCFAKHVLQ